MCDLAGERRTSVARSRRCSFRQLGSVGRMILPQATMAGLPMSLRVVGREGRPQYTAAVPLRRHDARRASSAFASRSRARLGSACSHLSRKRP